MEAYATAFPFYSAKPTLLLTKDEALEFPHFIRQNGIFRRMVVPPLVPYSSAPPFDVASFTKALHQPFASASLVIPPACSSGFSPQVWQAQGWQVSPRQTFETDLALPWGFFDRWDRKRRYALRKATSLFESTRTGAILDTIQLLTASYAAHQRPLPVLVSQLAQLLKILLEKKLGTHFQAKDAAGKVVASIFVLHENRRAYYWLAGADRHVAGEPMLFLMMELMHYLAHSGIEVLDLCGANHSSIAAFKQKFADRLVPYYFLHLPISPVFKGLQWLKNLR